MFGSFLKISLTCSWILGIRVEPPTKITSSIFDAVRPASLIALIHGSTVLSIRSETNSSNLARVNVRFKCFGPDESAVTKGRLISACLELDSSVLAVSADSRRRCNAMGSFFKSTPSDFLNSEAIQSITF